MKRADRFVGVYAGLVLLAGGAATLSAAVTYTFESLASGSLVGQDNWSMPVGNTSPQVGNGAGADQTKVAMYGGAGVLPAWRPNDGAFSFGVFSNTATTAYLEFDAREADLVANSTERFYVFYQNSNGVYSTSPWIGLNGGSFEVRGANGGSVTTVPVAAGIDVGDWVRLRLVMDFTDTSGGRSGSMDAYYVNLTDNQSSYTPISGLQDINMQLNRNQSLPSTWNALAIRFDVSSGSGRQVDNLTVNVPEPEVPLLGLVGVACGWLRRSRRGAR